MPDGADQAPVGERAGEGAGAVGGLGQRLLDQRVHAGAGQLEADLLVVDGGGRDDDIVEALCDQLVDVGEDVEAAGQAVRVARGVGDGDQVDAVDRAQVARVVAAHHAQPDQARAKVCHQAPALASAFTASTMRSRSCGVSDGCTGSDRHSRAACSVPSRCASTWKGFRRWFGTG